MLSYTDEQKQMLKNSRHKVLNFTAKAKKPKDIPVDEESSDDAKNRLKQPHE